MNFKYFLLLTFLITVGSKYISKLLTGVKRFTTQFLVSGSLALVSPLTASSVDAYAQYQNERYHTTLSYPSEWVQKSGELSGERKLEAFVDPKDSDISASIVYTPIPGDFTRLTSFGDLHSYLVPKGEGIECTVLEETQKGNGYIVEYIIKTPESPAKHIRTIFGLRPAESVVGLTIQSSEEKYESLKNDFKKISDSFIFDVDYKS